MRLIAVIAITMLAAAAQAGEVYKWKDKDGVTHYGDRPKTVPAQTLEVPTSPTLDPAAAKAQADREADCRRKKAQLETYRAAPSISETDNLGKTREYSEAERQQFIALTEKKVAEACAPAATAATTPP